MLGLTFQIGAHRLALDVRRVVDVVPAIALEPVADAPEWLCGVLLFRGRVAPVIDLFRLMKAGECPVHLSTRIIFVQIDFNGHSQMFGLRAARVADIREFSIQSTSAEDLAASDRPDLGKVFVHEGEIFHLVELECLLPEAYRQLVWSKFQELPTWT